MRTSSRPRITLLFAMIIVALGHTALASPMAEPSVAESSTDPVRAAVDRLVADYIGLYAGPTIDRWQTLFHPAVVVAFPDDDGSITTRTLDEFVTRQKNYFATGRQISERLENVRIDMGRRIARVSADFIFMDEGDGAPRQTGAAPGGREGRLEDRGRIILLRRGMNIRRPHRIAATGVTQMSQPQRGSMNTLKRLLQSSFAVASLMLGTTALISGCASTPAEPQQMRDPQADFNAFKTFAWKANTSAGNTDKPVSVVDGYIRAAITTELTRKGYVEAAAGTTPDLRIEYEAVSAEKLKNNPFRVGIGVGSYGSSGGGSVGVGSPSVKNVKEGTLVIHVIDPARNAEVWRGSASRELGKGNVEPATVQSVVADMLSDFPARGGQS